MKTKTKKFRVGDNTYFHHQHGIFVPKKRARSMALSLSVLVVMFGGFFVGKEYAWPLLKNNSQVQRVQQIASENVVSPAPDSDADNAQPIRHEDELLTSVLEDKLATFPDSQKWSVFVYDLDTERTAMLGTDDVYSSASLYKLFLLEALEKKLPFDQWQWTWVEGDTVANCVDSMLKASDNPCAQELAEYIGWDAINNSVQKNGFKNTKIENTNGRVTTASDVGELLARLKKGQMLSDSARRFVFDSLYQQNLKKGIPKGCKKCRTANKTAELSNVSHDAGIVTHGSHDYVLVVMSEGGSFKQISEITKLVELEFAPR